jgi:hypothetical protein
LLLIARHYDGPRGVWAYAAFDALNAAFFDGRLATPRIQWAITPHGGCLGLTARASHPVVTLHPSILGGTEKANPWGIPPEWLGIAYAFDVLLHEAVHVAQHQLYGGISGPMSHNDPGWIAEVNRIAPLIGLEGVEAGRSRLKRVPIEGGSATKVVRVSEGNLPHKVVSRFPYMARFFFGTADGYYRTNVLPVIVNSVLQP